MVVVFVVEVEGLDPSGGAGQVLQARGVAGAGKIDRYAFIFIFSVVQHCRIWLGGSLLGRHDPLHRENHPVV